jgi:hypothetical protein
MVFLLSVFARPLEPKGGTPRAFVRREKENRAAEGKASDSFAGTALPAACGVAANEGPLLLKKTQLTYAGPMVHNALVRRRTAVVE